MLSRNAPTAAIIPPVVERMCVIDAGSLERRYLGAG
jgi:hypothetical protein